MTQDSSSKIWKMTSMINLKEFKRFHELKSGDKYNVIIDSAHENDLLHE